MASMLRAFGSLVRSELRLFFREPAAVFFTLLFPVLLLVVMGPIFGNEASPAFGGYGSLDTFVPAFTSIALGSFSLIGLPVTLATYRERGILRRYRATPLPMALVPIAQSVVCLLVVVLTAAALCAVAAVAFDPRMPASPWSAAGALVCTPLAFSTLGFVLGSVLSSTRTAQAVGNAVFFPMLFLSGAAMPRILFPDWMRAIGDVLPLTWVVDLLLDLWVGRGWNGWAVVLLGLLLVAGTTATSFLNR